MKRTRLAVLISFTLFILLCAATGGYELWTVFNNVPNDTISHVVVSWSNQYHWLRAAIIFGMSFFMVFWFVAILHWFRKGFCWKAPIFLDETDEEKKND